MAVHCFFVPAGGALSDLPGLTPPEARALVNDLRAWPDAHAGRILPLVAAEAKLVWAWPSLADAVRAIQASDERFPVLAGAWELVVAEALVAMADPRLVRPVSGAVAPRLLDPGGAAEHARAIYGGPAHLVARPGPVRARKLERARRVVAKYGSFPEIAAMIEAGIESIEAGREQSNALARMASCAARAHTQVG